MLSLSSDFLPPKKIESSTITKAFKPMALLFNSYFSNSITKKEIDENIFSPRFKFLNESDYPTESDYQRVMIFRDLIQKIEPSFSKGKNEAFILDFNTLSNLPKSEHNFTTLVQKSAERHTLHITDEKVRQEVLRNYLVDFVASLYCTQMKSSELNFLIIQSTSHEKSIKELEEKILSYTLESLSRTIDEKSMVCELLMPLSNVSLLSNERVKRNSQFVTNFNWEIEESMLVSSWGNPEYVLEQLKKDFFNNLVNLDFEALSQDKASPNFVPNFIDIFFDNVKKSSTRYGQNLLAGSELPNFLLTSRQVFNKLLEHPYFLEKLEKDNMFVELFLKTSFLTRKDMLAGEKLNKFQQFLFDNFLSKKEFCMNFISYLGKFSGNFQEQVYASFILKDFFASKEAVAHIMLSYSKSQGSSCPNVFKMLGIEEFFERENFLYFCSQPYTMNLDGIINDSDDYARLATKAITSLTLEEITACAENQVDFMFSCIAQVPDFWTNKNEEYTLNLLNTFAYSANLDKSSLFDDFYLKLPLPLQQSPKLLEALLSATNHTLELPVNLIEFLNKPTLIYYTSKNVNLLRHTLAIPKYFKDPDFIGKMKFDDLYKLSKFKVSPYLAEVCNFTPQEQQGLIAINPLYYKFASSEVKKDLVLAKNYALSIIEPQSSIFGEKDTIDLFFKEVPTAILQDPEVSLKVINCMPQLINTLVPKQFWYNQAFILSFCQILDKKDANSRALLLKNVSPSIEKLFKAFDIKPGASYNFMVNYFEKIELNKQLRKNITPVSTTSLALKNKNKL